MKKYKLIKEYPGSPELGYIISPIKDAIFPHYYYKQAITPEVIENSPEFWEEVIEKPKSYEILSFVANENHGLKGYIVHIVDGKSTVGNNLVEEYIQDVDDWWEIYSVKRLSDGKVFTIGDRVNDEYTINRFELSKWFSILVYINEGHQGWISFENLYHSKKPIFTSDDGVDIFEKQIYFDTGGESWKPRFRMCEKGDQNYSFPKFSTEEAVKEYIRNNKPIFSFNDVYEEFRSIKDPHNLFKNKLLELLEKKLR